MAVASDEFLEGEEVVVPDGGLLAFAVGVAEEVVGGLEGGGGGGVCGDGGICGGGRRGRCGWRFGCSGTGLVVAGGLLLAGHVY